VFPSPRLSHVLFALAIILVASATHGQILQNGSFENDYASWAATGHQAIVANDPNHPATDGSKVVVFNINDQITNALLSQTLATTPGQRYDLAFDYGVVGSVTDQRLEVTLDGNGNLLDQTVVIASPGTKQPFYVPQHIAFTANSPNTKLTFFDASYAYVAIDSMLDNVRVTAVDPNAPVITAPPQRTAVAQGKDATFRVTATGAISYQWQFNGANISGATSSSYTVTAAGTNKAGNYSVVVTNASGSVKSSGATLTILPPGILLNGSFEYGSAGWIFSGPSVTTSTNTSFGVTDGVVLTHFNWGQMPPNANISQTFSTTSNQTYVVNFDLGAYSVVNQNEQRCRVTVTNGSNSVVLATQSISVFANGNGGTYTPQTLTFVAGGPTATLTFQDISPTTTDVDLLLDNVRVRLQNAPPTPTPTATPAAQSVISYTLINANNGQDIQPLTNGATLNLATLPSTNLNVRANTSPSTVGSVVFALSGAQSTNHTENGAPYALFGDNGAGIYTAWTPPTGPYTLTASPFTGANGSGTGGNALTINFTVTNQSGTPTPTPTPTPNTHTHTHSHCYANRHPDCNAYCYANVDPNCHSDCNPDSDTNRNPGGAIRYLLHACKCK
jgi:hypothetical protein